MKILKIISRIFIVLSLAAMMAGIIIAATSSYDYEYGYAIVVTVEPLILIAMTIGVVSEFSEESATFRKVGLALLIAGAVCLIGTGLSSYNYALIASFALVVLGLGFKFIVYLLDAGEISTNSFDEKLEKLQKTHELLEKKILTEDEYNEMRAKILGVSKKRK